MAAFRTGKFTQEAIDERLAEPGSTVAPCLEAFHLFVEHHHEYLQCTEGTFHTACNHEQAVGDYGPRATRSQSVQAVDFR